VLQSNPGAINAYKISNLIQFYDSTITKIIGQLSQLSVSLNDLNQVSHRVFFDTLNAQASHLLRFVGAPDSDLLPPLSVKETLAQLKDILSSYDGSLLPEHQKEKEVEQVLTATLDPLLQMCVEGSAKLSLIESATYMINSLHFIQMALVLYPFTAKHVKIIEIQIDTQIQVLIGEMYGYMLGQSRLGAILTVIENNHEKTPLALIPTTSPKDITETMQWLDIFLGTLGPDDSTSSITRLLSSTRLARQVLSGAHKMFLEAYGVVYESVMDPKNLYEFPGSLGLRGVGDVKHLFFY